MRPLCALSNSMLLLCVTSPVYGQQQAVTFEFQFPQGVIYTGGAPIRVELWAYFDPSHLAFAQYHGDIVGTDPTGQWSGLTATFNVPVNVGTPSAGSVIGLSLTNALFPPNFFPNTSNPLLLWSGDWSTTELTPRLASIETDTVSAHAWTTTGQSMGFFEIIEATAQIQVIPAPPAFAFLALAGGLACRRQRVRA